MKILHLLFLVVISIFTGCSYSAPEPIEVELKAKKIDYLVDVKPILDKRCVTCHSCYNSPCQAKFSSYEGIDRGGSKEKVYLAERLFAQKPSRLFIDAKSTQEWRTKKFFTLRENLEQEDLQDAHDDEKESNSSIRSVNSIMAHMLYDKKENPEVVGIYAPEYDTLTCAKNLEEVGEYQAKHPNHGMPYGFPALDEKEYQVIMQWLAQGAQGPSAKQQERLTKPSDDAQDAIDAWEAFLNQEDAKHVMTARYLYEHYFLAHINFNPKKREFYRLVRSRTPSGEVIDEIATRRPYNSPGEAKFYYRFLKIHSTIVHKTHILVKFSKAELARIDELFIKRPWLQEPHVVSYDKKLSSNPFLVYAQIPTSSRYEFLLDHSEYIVRTFIRGPVCKGQIALNVIHDHFWVMFQDPQHDLGVMNPKFLMDEADNLSMPIVQGSEGSVFQVFSDKFRKKYADYYVAKEHELLKYRKDDITMESIWKGRQASDAPALTVYRHFDSASVHKGFLGELPRTMWVIDYAQLERIYYSLVAGFDVFGNVTHQTNIRRYMDFLRLEGELNFLFYMPQNVRGAMLASWYIGDDIVEDIQNSKRDISQQIPTAVKYKTDKPKQEFVERLVDTHFLKSTNIHFDHINYFRIGESIPPLPKVYHTKEDIDQGLRALTAPGTGFIKYVTADNLNVIVARVNMNDGSKIMGTFIVNRWHDNVNSLFGETKRLNPNKDTLDIIRGSIGSYPNVFIVVKEDELPDFFDLLANFTPTQEYIQKVKNYGVSRSDKDFWKEYDWFQEEFNKEEPLESGLYDLNRYYKKPW